MMWHWPCEVAKEAGTAFDHYRPAFADWKARWPDLVGHAHPSAWQMVLPHYRAEGIEAVGDFEDVVRRAAVLIVDNSSAGPEWLALGRPVVWLDSPWWRRDVYHGGRFWEWPQGQPWCQQPSEVPAAIDRSLERRPEDVAAQRTVADAVFPKALRGSAATRAAAALMSLL